MSISVIGFPLAGHVGVPSTSTLLLRISGKSLPSLPPCVKVPLTVVGCVDPDLCSCFIDVLAFLGLGSGVAVWSCEPEVCLVVRDAGLLEVKEGIGREILGIATYVGSAFAPSGFSSVN